MSRPFAPGTRVRTAATTPAGHSRLPAYARGKSGTVVEYEGSHPLPGVLDAPAEPVYAVLFHARDLWGMGDHAVTVDLWEGYLVEDT